MFFDSDCLLCSRFVVFLLKKDKKHNLHFAPLAGEVAGQLSIKDKVSHREFDSIVFFCDAHLYTRSHAVLKIFQTIGGGWKIMAVFYVVPAFIRDAIYNFVARNRYRWFGKKKYCYLPEKSEAKYFLT